jgi:hypothetical protein
MAVQLGCGHWPKMVTDDGKATPAASLTGKKLQQWETKLKNFFRGSKASIVVNCDDFQYLLNVSLNFSWLAQIFTQNSITWSQISCILLFRNLAVVTSLCTVPRAILYKYKPRLAQANVLQMI